MIFFELKFVFNLNHFLFFFGGFLKKRQAREWGKGKGPPHHDCSLTILFYDVGGEGKHHQRSG